MKATMLITVFLVSGFILVGSLAGLLADDTAEHSSHNTVTDLTTANTGAYYDELWNATRIFRTQQIGTTGTVLYAVKDLNGSAPNNRYDTAQDPTVRKDDGSGNYTALPQHTVVTEWEVSGHVHFPN